MLSREYLINRGTCCGLGCRMCPYIPPHQEGNTNMYKENIYVNFMWRVLKWGMVGFLLLGAEGCIQPSLKVESSSPPILISITDERSDEHKYRNFPYSGTSQETHYCAVHYHWETIQPYYTHHGVLKIRVTRHPKSK